MDGPWVPSAHEASIFTVLIYLNDATTSPACHGGQTNFLAAAAAHAPDGASPHAAPRDDDRVVRRSVTPKVGRALVFKHDLLHEALHPNHRPLPLHSMYSRYDDTTRHDTTNDTGGSAGGGGEVRAAHGAHLQARRLSAHAATRVVG
jgi:hypothetical protein